MSDSRIGLSARRLKRIRKEMKEGQLCALRELLPDHAIDQACRTAGYRYRRRLLTPVVTLWHYLLAALWPEDSLQAAADIGGLPGNRASISKARQRLPKDVVFRLGRFASGLGQRLSHAYAREGDLRVVSIDGTCVSMEDNPALKEAFQVANTKHGMGKFPTARVVAAMLPKTGVMLDYRIGPYRTSEQLLGMELLDALGKGDLLIGDAHFAGSNLYFRYQERGIHFLTPSHQALKVSRLQKRYPCADGSFICDMPIWPVHRRKYPYLPAKMTLRFIPMGLQQHRRGRRQAYLVTSLLDAKRHPARMLRRLYQLRWPIETSFGHLKQALSVGVLRSRKVESIHKELAAKVIAWNLLCCVALQAAIRHGRKPDRICVSRCRRLVVGYSLRMSVAPIHSLPMLYDDMLSQIAMHPNPHRPGRTEPRAVRREQKQYDRLKTTRAQWRQLQAEVA